MPSVAFWATADYILAYTTPELFHDPPEQLFWVGVTDLRGGMFYHDGTFHHVAKAYRDQHVGVFIRRRGCGLFSLRFVEIRFKIVEYGMRVRSCFLFWDRVPYFLGLAFPFLNDAEAKLS